MHEKDITGRKILKYIEVTFKIHILTEVCLIGLFIYIY